MNYFRKAWLIGKHLGPDWVAFRLRYALLLRSGAMQRRTPLKSWDEINVESYLPAWLQAPDWPASGKGWGNGCITAADGLSQGEFCFFSNKVKSLGCPPDWHKNAFTGQDSPRDCHWSKLGDFDFGDIKVIWELSRFNWAYTLARAYARKHEARLAELYWKLFTDWCEQNPPNQGVNWKCGQESTFRLMAATFAIAQFGRTAEATTGRLQLWSRFVLATGRRVAANIEYALSQSNNHGVSESIGLLTASLLSRETDETRDWRLQGWRHLQSQLNELVYADGGFSQHSLVYHRVLLHDLYWLIALCRQAGETVPDWLIEKARMARDFLKVLVDSATGSAPLYGANDGACVLPLDECAFDDFRGTVQAGGALLDNRRFYEPGPWDEALFWLTGRDPDVFPILKETVSTRWHAPQAGCWQAISGASRLFLRCPTHFRHRPSQMDMLHADIWWRGQMVAHDAGSYSNNMPPPLGGAFGKAQVHNVPMLLDQEPSQRVSRFLFLPWPEGSVEKLSAGESVRATHTGYGQIANVERQVISPAKEIFLIKDKITLQVPGRVRLHWLLADFDWILDSANAQITAKIGDGFYKIAWTSPTAAMATTLVRADPVSARGWWSRHYLAVEPAVSLELIYDVVLALEITTRFNPQGC